MGFFILDLHIALGFSRSHKKVSIRNTVNTKQARSFSGNHQGGFWHFKKQNKQKYLWVPGTKFVPFIVWPRVANSKIVQWVKINPNVYWSQQLKFYKGKQKTSNAWVWFSRIVGCIDTKNFNAWNNQFLRSFDAWNGCQYVEMCIDFCVMAHRKDIESKIGVCEYHLEEIHERMMQNLDIGVVDLSILSTLPQRLEDEEDEVFVELPEILTMVAKDEILKLIKRLDCINIRYVSWTWGGGSGP